MEHDIMCQKLIEQGYKIQVTNPMATNFSEKYLVFKEVHLEDGMRRYAAIVDDRGKITTDAEVS